MEYQCLGSEALNTQSLNSYGLPFFFFFIFEFESLKNKLFIYVLAAMCVLIALRGLSLVVVSEGSLSG